MPPETQLSRSFPSSSPNQPGRTRAAIGFTEARVAAEKAEVLQQRQAARRVAEHSRDVHDCREMLLMLGLSGLAPTEGATR